MASMATTNIPSIALLRVVGKGKKEEEERKKNCYTGGGGHRAAIHRIGPEFRASDTSSSGEAAHTPHGQASARLAACCQKVWRVDSVGPSACPQRRQHLWAEGKGTRHQLP